MRLLIGVSGGIAAYKALETARLAVKAGHAVRVIQTPTSERFVGQASFAGITGAPVLTSEFDDDPARGAYPGEPVPERAPISHLALVERADVYLIAPASANTIAKLAAGAADNLVTTAALAAACPIAVAPAMNNRMYLNPATQANLRTLAGARRHGDPARRRASSPRHGERGVGRLAEPQELLAACTALLEASGARLAPSGHNGGEWSATSERLSAERYWPASRFWSPPAAPRSRLTASATSATTPPAAWATRLPREALGRGAEVTIVSANVKLEPPPGATCDPGARPPPNLADACAHAFPASDVLLMAAAVADFRPAAPADHKLKKTSTEALDADRARADRGRTGGAGGAAASGATAGRLRRRARRGSARQRTREARAQAARRDRGQRHLPRRHRLQRSRQRGRDPDPRRWRAPRPAHCQGTGRRGDPGRARALDSGGLRTRRWRRRPHYTK